MDFVLALGLTCVTSSYGNILGFWLRGACAPRRIDLASLVWGAPSYGARRFPNFFFFMTAVTMTTTITITTAMTTPMAIAMTTKTTTEQTETSNGT